MTSMVMYHHGTVHQVIDHRNRDVTVDRANAIRENGGLPMAAFCGVRPVYNARSKTYDRWFPLQTMGNRRCHVCFPGRLNTTVTPNESEAGVVL